MGTLASVVGAVAVGALLFALIRRASGRRRRWRGGSWWRPAEAVAQRLGLAPVRRLAQVVEFRGLVDRMEVSIVAYGGSTTIRAYPPAGGGAATPWNMAPSAGNDQGVTGDPGFDARVTISGADSPRLVALLGAETRRKLADIVPAGEDGAFLTIAPDRVVAVESHGGLDAAALGDIADRVLWAARALRDSATAINGRLRQMVRADPSPRMRARALIALRRRGRRDEAFRAVVDEALMDESPIVALQAARLKDGETTGGGIATIDLMVDALARHPAPMTSTERDWLMGGAKDMVRRLSPERASAAISRVLREQPNQPARAAVIRAVGARGMGLVVPELIDAGHAEAALRDVVIDVLSELQDPRIQGAFATWIDPDNPRQYGVLVRWLGAHADVGAVASLMAVADGVFRDGAVKRAARAAVAQIQARADGADRGQLALAGPAGADGRLAVAASAEAGALVEVAEEEAD